MLIFAATTSPSAALSAATMPLSKPMEWSFAVQLDGKPIGTHKFMLRQDGKHLRLQTEASFDVKFLFFTAYTYRHRNTEVWDERGLVSIEAYTDANGKIHYVSGARDAGHFVVRTGEEKELLPSELMTFAYWNPAILDQSHLLNSQTGDYEAVTVVDRGEETVEFRGKPIAARRYDLQLANDSYISLWYALEDNTWIALESLTESGRVLTYKPVLLPHHSTELANNAER